MNRDKITSQQSSFFQVSTKQRIEKWVKDVNRFSIKSIYNLRWIEFHRELRRLGTKEFLKQYGYSCKKKLQLVIAKSEFWQRGITLYDFEKSTEQELLDRLGNSFFNKVTRQPNFNPKNHKLSTIHYFIYHHSFHFTAISLGFASKQCFLNFFAQTLFVSEYGEMAQNLRSSILSLYEMDPIALREKLPDLYDKPLAKNENFIKYNYTLEELKLALENENTVLVVASLGGVNAYTFNKKLQTLRPWINVNLQTLKLQSWEELMINTPIFFWKIKLYQFFSGQIPLEQWPYILCIPRPLRSSSNVQWQFFNLQHASHTEERDVIELSQQSSSPLSSYVTEIVLSPSVYCHTY